MSLLKFECVRTIEVAVRVTEIRIIVVEDEFLCEMIFEVLVTTIADRFYRRLLSDVALPTYRVIYGTKISLYLFPSCN